MYRKFNVLISFVLVASMACTCFGQILIGDFEGSFDGWTPAGGVTITLDTFGATVGTGSLRLYTAGSTWYALYKNVPVGDYIRLSLNITWMKSEWAPQTGGWVQLRNVALNSNGPSGWTAFDPPVYDSVNPWYPGGWDPVNWGDETRTLEWDTSTYDASGATWMQVHFPTNFGGFTSVGAYYLDNIQLHTVPLVPVPPIGSTYQMRDSRVRDVFATMSGGVIDDGNEPCSYRFRYWPAGGAEMTTGWRCCAGDHAILRQRIEGLTPNTTYYFQLELSNSAGSDLAPPKTFTTLPQLTISSTEGGSVIGPGEGIFGFASDSEVILEAEANPCYVFMNWAGPAVDAGLVADPGAAITTLTMNDGTAVEAVFDYMTLVGNFEDGSLDGFEVSWEGLASIAVSDIGATVGSGSLAITAPTGWTWAVLTNVVPNAYHTVMVDVTWVAAEWDVGDGAWINFKEMAVNSGGPSGWMQVVPTDSANADYPGSWDPVNWGDNTRTLTWDISGYDYTGSDWMQLIFSSNMGGVNTPGNHYIDNVRAIGGGPVLPDPILKLDVQGSDNPAEVEEGFTPFTFADSGSEIDGIIVTLGDYSTGDHRRRDVPAGVPYENIYRDFIFGRQGSPGVGYVTVTLSGLDPNGEYLVTIYAWDTYSTNPRVTDWSANGEYLLTTEHDGNVNPPNSEDSYAFTGVGTADETGTLFLEAVPGAGTFAAEPFAFLNALVLRPYVDVCPQ